MRTETIREITSVSSSLCITEIARITWNNKELLLVNNNKAAMVDGKEYTPCGFKYSPPSDSGDGSIEIDDVDGTLTYAIQSTESMEIEISLIDVDDTSYRIEGPIYFKADSASATSKGTVTIDIALTDRISYALSKFTYSTSNFPGLF